jgi:hypothetical protein
MTTQTKVDMALILDENGMYDVASYGFDTTILMLIASELRAGPDLMSDPLRRRGWIGNETPDRNGFLAGSYLWTTEQGRVNTDTKNQAVDVIQKALSQLVPLYLNAVNVSGTLETEGISVSVDLIRKAALQPMGTNGAINGLAITKKL